MSNPANPGNINPTWAPLFNTITAITNANPAQVTTGTNHGYVVGLYVRFFFPANFGMAPLNDNVFLIINIPTPTTFLIDANTIDYAPFTISTTKQIPQVIPVAEISQILSMAERNTLIPIGGGI